MTDKSLGDGNFGWFVATAVDRMSDPKKAGRVTLRVHGVNDDQSNVPDSDLFYGYPATTIHSASMNGIGHSPTSGVMPGSTVFGFWLDKDKTIPVMTHTMHRSDTSDQNSGGAQQSSGSAPPNDVNVNGRSTQDFNQVINANMIQLAANNSLFNTLKSIGSFQFGGGTGVSVLGKGGGAATTAIQDLINQVDNGNKAGSVQGGPNIAKAALSLAKSGGDTGSLSSLMNLIQQFFTQAFAQTNQNTSNLNNFLSINTQEQLTNLNIVSSGNNYNNNDLIIFNSPITNGISGIITNGNGNIISLSTLYSAGVWANTVQPNQISLTFLNENGGSSNGTGANISFSLQLIN